MPLVHFFLFSEISVALCALGLGALSQLLVYGKLDLMVIALTGAATFLFYTVERNLTLPKPEFSIFPEKSRWLKDHRCINIGLIAIASGITLVLLPRLSSAGMVSLGVFGGLAACYSIIRLPWGLSEKRGLKQFYLLKSLLMVLVWTYLTLLLPFVESGQAVDGRMLLLSGIWTGWIFSNSILFDIRDLEIDRAQGCETLAAKLGRLRAHQLIITIAVFELALIMLYGRVFSDTWAAVAMMLSTLAFLCCNYWLQKKKTLGLSFYILADLTLILPTLTLGLHHLGSI